jgi:hypothetical protein
MLGAAGTRNLDRHDVSGDGTDAGAAVRELDPHLGDAIADDRHHARHALAIGAPIGREDHHSVSRAQLRGRQQHG